MFLNTNTNFNEDHLFCLNEKGVIIYEEIGEDGFKPIRICNVKIDTHNYLKKILNELANIEKDKNTEITNLNKRIVEILTFDPNKLSAEIKTTQSIIDSTKKQIESNPILKSLSNPLSQIEIHFNSLSKVANNYEDVYKNIILPVREEGKSGVRQTVKWAIIGIITSTIISALISWLTK